jgi:hypothetical protein
MSDIDWLAVEMVCNGATLQLTGDEKRVAMRRLSEKMLTNSDCYYSSSHKLTAEEISRRMKTTTRSVQRLNSDLPPAHKTTCPVCRQTMWISNGVVEPHPDSLYVDCPMTGRQTLRGLAAVRPDLYRWALVNAS